MPPEAQPNEPGNAGMARLGQLRQLVSAMEDAASRGDTDALTELCQKAAAAAAELSSNPLPPEALADLEELHAKYARLCLILTQQRQEMQQGMAHLAHGLKTLKLYRQE
jgi:DNA-binding GntR family transcriptional regulator